MFIHEIACCFTATIAFTLLYSSWVRVSASEKVTNDILQFMFIIGVAIANVKEIVYLSMAIACSHITDLISNDISNLKEFVIESRHITQQPPINMCHLIYPYMTQE